MTVFITRVSEYRIVVRMILPANKSLDERTSPIQIRFWTEFNGVHSVIAYIRGRSVACRTDVRLCRYCARLSNLTYANFLKRDVWTLNRLDCEGKYQTWVSLLSIIMSWGTTASSSFFTGASPFRTTVQRLIVTADSLSRDIPTPSLSVMQHWKVKSIWEQWVRKS